MAEDAIVTGPLTTEEHRLYETYTRAAKRGERLDEEWAAELVIDHQSFSVVEERSEEEADWFRRMLAAALARMLKTEVEVRLQRGSLYIANHPEPRSLFHERHKSVSVPADEPARAYTPTADGQLNAAVARMRAKEMYADEPGLQAPYIAEAVTDALFSWTARQGEDLTIDVNVKRLSWALRAVLPNDADRAAFEHATIALVAHLRPPRTEPFDNLVMLNRRLEERIEALEAENAQLRTQADNERSNADRLNAQWAQQMSEFAGRTGDDLRALQVENAQLRAPLFTEDDIDELRDAAAYVGEMDPRCTLRLTQLADRIRAAFPRFESGPPAAPSGGDGDA